ncbi:unnamed protein product [Pleuronectes platessa]|uniref:Uncharacterized protein n=1 Tax=Pleuronectes platessa TaxID=8262 RepID=A0A9N7VTT8_PLEPL|nr:unnamed protein product [Pleuronectes platessa]
MVVLVGAFCVEQPVKGPFLSLAPSTTSNWLAQSRQLEGQRLHCSAEASLWLNTAGGGRGIEAGKNGWGGKDTQGSKPLLILCFQRLQTPATGLPRSSSSSPPLSFLFLHT